MTQLFKTEVFIGNAYGPGYSLQVRPHLWLLLFGKPLKKFSAKQEHFEMSTNKSNLDELVKANVDFLTVVISKDEILRRDTSEPMKLFRQLLSNQQIARYFRERLEISFDGYNNVRDELWEIPEVRNYVIQLDSEFPYWLYFLSKKGTGLYAIIKCFLLPHLNTKAEKDINTPRLQSYLETRGFPAMNQLCERFEISEVENIEMTNRFTDYFTNRQSGN